MKAGGIPNSYHDAIDILSGHHVFTLPQSETYKKMFGFRNHIVHQYAKIDPVEVYRAMTERLNDLEEFIAVWLLIFIYKNSAVRLAA